MWQYIVPVLVSGALSGIGSALERPRVTQKYVLDKISEWQDLIRKSAYSAIPAAVVGISEMAGKAGLTNESQAGMRYAEIANLVSTAEQEAAKLGAMTTLEAVRLPSGGNWFTEFLKGFYPGMGAGADISSLIAYLSRLSSLQGNQGTQDNQIGQGTSSQPTTADIMNFGLMLMLKGLTREFPWAKQP